MSGFFNCKESFLIVRSLPNSHLITSLAGSHECTRPSEGQFRGRRKSVLRVFRNTHCPFEFNSFGIDLHCLLVFASGQDRLKRKMVLHILRHFNQILPQFIQKPIIVLILFHISFYSFQKPIIVRPELFQYQLQLFTQVVILSVFGYIFTLVLLFFSTCYRCQSML